MVDLTSSLEGTNRSEAFSSLETMVGMIKSIGEKLGCGPIFVEKYPHSIPKYVS